MFFICYFAFQAETAELERQLRQLKLDMEKVGYRTKPSNRYKNETWPIGKGNSLQNVILKSFQSTTSSSRTEEQLGGELTSAKHQLLQVREQLEMAEQELERKFSQTGAYQNMKKMLAQKNSQIKDLRKNLAK